MTAMDLSTYGIPTPKVLRNLGPASLYEEALANDPGAKIASTGALLSYSGERTGRSPKDKRVARHPESERDIWWGPVNMPTDELSFAINRERAQDYLNTLDQVYVVDAYCGWDPDYRLKVRLICARPYHALFLRNMLIVPDDDDLATFGEPDFVIYNAGPFPANRSTTGTSSDTSVSLSFERGEMVILGTEYAGEMKKGVFTVMNYLMPKRGALSMHCSATVERDGQTSSLFFGLSGTGKTTLSADPKRDLVGDDEHVWTDKGVFNIEGGCYAKTLNLTQEGEPDIYNAIRFGAILENVIHDENHDVDYRDSSITQNTRASYPIHFIDNARIPCVAGHPNRVIFLTCDAFGVLPPVSRLTPEQAMYHFISGYTAKVAGTEMGVTEPEATFSPCFGGPFLVWHPAKYAAMLAEKIKTHGESVYLVNTGWSGGGYGVGHRISLSHTRAIIDAIHSGALVNAPTVTDPIFGVEVPTKVPGVPDHTLIPRNAWSDPAAYDQSAARLAGLFIHNFRHYEDGADEAVKKAGPKL